MKKIKIIATFIYCRDGELVKLARRILDSVKDNPSFATPTPALADVEKALTDYISALSNAGGRDREMVSIKNDKKAVLQQLLTDLAHYVTQASKGDKTMLISSGFDITPDRSSQTRLPNKMAVELDSPGQVTTRVKRVPRARAYIHEYTPDPITPASVWTRETTIKNEFTFTGLSSASKIWLRVTAIASNGEKISWEPVPRIIQ
jgi:hypothetical protein